MVICSNKWSFIVINISYNLNEHVIYMLAVSSSMKKWSFHDTKGVCDWAILETIEKQVSLTLDNIMSSVKSRKKMKSLANKKFRAVKNFSTL